MADKGAVAQFASAVVFLLPVAFNEGTFTLRPDTVMRFEGANATINGSKVCYSTLCQLVAAALSFVLMVHFFH
jgi:hypothetical protein